MPPADSKNIGVALGLVCAAGASTALGAAVVFFPSIVKLASRRVLASSLGFSAGVMTYISFVEIFQKAVFHFGETGDFDEDRSYQLATVCFFGGVVTMMLLNWAVSVLLGGEHGHGHTHADSKQPESEGENAEHGHGEHTHGTAADPNAGLPCCSPDPVGRLETMNRMAEELAQNDDDSDDSGAAPVPAAERHDISHLSAHSHTHGHQRHTANNGDAPNLDSEENHKLVRMGINTAVAIGLHNFPEGLATFVAALDDPAVGAILAFAIAIHNIPEGLCVALPIYYATGNRMKAFLWALLSGASEFVAALLGWAVLANSFSDSLYATLFGMVAGMMVIISIRELLPTAHFYDPEDTVVTYSFIGGMFLIAASLVLFTL